MVLFYQKKQQAGFNATYHKSLQVTFKGKFMNLSDITKTIFQSIPNTIMPTEQDTELLRKHKKLLLSYENDLVIGFNNAENSDENLQTALASEIKKQREQSLREWYQISITCDFDQHYWDWQVFSGILNVKYNIANASVLAMWSSIMTTMQHNLLRDLEVDEALKVLSVFQKLQTVVTSLVIEANVAAEKEGIRLASGLNSNILTRMVNIEIDRLVAQGEKELTLSDMQEQKVA